MASELRGRPTLYKGIRMRSRLEADYAAYLDDGGTEWEYEPECFGGPGGQWLPDFRTRKSSLQRWLYIELKPSSLITAGEDPDDFVGDRINAVLRKMEIALASDPDACLQLVIWEWGKTRPVMRFMHVPTQARSPLFEHEGWMVFGSPLPIALAWPWKTRKDDYRA